MISSFKASPFPGETIPDLVLSFDHEPPDVTTDRRTWESDWRRQYEAEGDRIEAELFSHLPGGLYDQILRAMLARKASLLKVSHRVPA